VIAVQGKSALDWPYIDKWCREHGTTDVLAEAVAEATLAMDDLEPRGIGPGF